MFRVSGRKVNGESDTTVTVLEYREAAMVGGDVARCKNAVRMSALAIEIND